MGKFADLHRHDEHSLFDGYGKAIDLAPLAKSLGYPALGLTNHGDMGGLVAHYYACKNNDIKPIMGNEVYFQPSFKEVRKSFHLCLFAKNLKGYKNLNKIVSKASRDNYYYKSLVTFELLGKYHDGLICSTACVGGLIPQLLIKEKYEAAERAVKRFKNIFGDDFYFELQPFSLTEENLQENVNIRLMDLAKKLDIKCIITSDSHFGSKDEFDSYLKMHEIGGHLELGEEYEERYMHTEDDIIEHFVDMHEDYFGSAQKAKKYALECIDNITELINKVDDEILEKLPLKLPVFDKNIDSNKLLLQYTKEGLKKRNKYNKRYLQRCKEEYEVITYLGFADYFLMVQDYCNWAREQHIEVGPGRGSACNSLVAYAIGITDVDSLYFDLDFRRFLRKDKKAIPDVDIDFEADYRGEVINYLLNKYKGHSARICSYGLYKVDNLLNDLFKVCGLALADKTDEHKTEKDPETIEIQKQIKRLVKLYIDPESGEFYYEQAFKNPEIIEADRNYNNIIVHFKRLYRKIRFYGSHAAGVAITGGNLYQYTSIERRGKDKNGEPVMTTSYDLVNIEELNVIKFDMLGLRTMSILRELRDLTRKPHYFDYSYLHDKEIFKQFNLQNTDGIFQFETAGAKKILKTIDADCYEDIIVANALNRPAPLSLGMPEMYAEGKRKFKAGEKLDINDKSNIFAKFTESTYGTFVFQEQVQLMCVEAGGMDWADADKVMKFMKKGADALGDEEAIKARLSEQQRLAELFIEGAVKNGYSRKVAEDAINKVWVYTFNKGHSAGYAVISIEQMYYKVHYNTEFWFVTLKYANEKDVPRLTSKAIADGVVVLLPHVNGCAKHAIVKIDGETAIQEGLTNVKGLGVKAAAAIEKERKLNGNFADYDDFYDRMLPYREVTKRTISILETEGALEFNKKRYFVRCQKYNSSLYGKRFK